MTGPTRMAGWGRAADGSTVTWTVAEGSKGRRWREVVALGDATVQALLLETDRDRRFSHLELARADGLWTFHPEPRRDAPRQPRAAGRWQPSSTSGAGRSVATTRWSSRARRSPSPRSSGHVPPRSPRASTASVAAVVIGADGELSRQASLQVERLSATRWRVGDGPAVDVDPDGLPILDGGSRQPLEQP